MDLLKKGLGVSVNDFYYKYYQDQFEAIFEKTSLIAKDGIESYSIENVLNALIYDKSNNGKSLSEIIEKEELFYKSLIYDAKVLAKTFDLVAKNQEIIKMFALATPPPIRVIISAAVEISELIQPIAYAAGTIAGFYGVTEIKNITERAPSAAGFNLSESRITESKRLNKVHYFMSESTEASDGNYLKKLKYNQYLRELQFALESSDTILIDSIRSVTSAQRDNVLVFLKNEINSIFSLYESSYRNIAGFQSLGDSILEAYSNLIKNEQSIFFIDLGRKIESEDLAVREEYIRHIEKAILYNDILFKYLFKFKASATQFGLNFSSLVDVDLLQYNFYTNKSVVDSITIVVINLGESLMENIVLRGASNDLIQIFGDSLFVLDSLYAGKQQELKFYYITPNFDTIANINLIMDIEAQQPQVYNFFVSTIPPTLDTPISIKSGLWSDPTTWSTGRIPDETSAVIIRHEVIIDIDATCKSIRAENPAQVQVAAGKKLMVLE
jgi:hypothetical protein